MQNNNMHNMNNNSGFNSVGDKNKQYNNTRIINNYYGDMTPEQLSKQARNQQAKPMLNGSERTILKTLVGRSIWIHCYVVGKRSEYDEYVLLTAINIRYRKQFVADHIHLKIPKELYNNIDHKLLFVKGVVYEYENNGNSSVLINTKQSLYVEEIKEIKSSDIRTDNQFINDLELNDEFINDKEVKSLILNDLIRKDKPDDLMFYKLETNISLLESILQKSEIPKGYITNYILNQYIINRNPNAINKEIQVLLECKKESAYEVSLIILAIIRRIKTKEITTLIDLFKFINSSLNSLHRLSRKIDPTMVSNKKELRLQLERQNEFKRICKEDRLNVDPYEAYRYIKDRNYNFGFNVIKCEDLINDALAVFGASNYYDILDLYDIVY